MEDLKTARVIVPMSTQLVKNIDAWRYANHVPSRAEAIRMLMETALAPMLMETALAPKRKRSAPK
jgi:metal-responsive CopG/Arc/MetJ family transcriptional regulator